MYPSLLLIIAMSPVYLNSCLFRQLLVHLLSLHSSPPVHCSPPAYCAIVCGMLKAWTTAADGDSFPREPHAKILYVGSKRIAILHLRCAERPSRVSS